MRTNRSLRTVMTLLAAAAALTACSKSDDQRTVGQKLDTAVAKTERAAAEANADAKVAAGEAKQATKEATASVSATARDVTITAKIKAELAKDPSLSAIRIDVDTRDGRVALSGTAPSDEARERATRLASAVEGVSGVDNRLVIKTKS